MTQILKIHSNFNQLGLTKIDQEIVQAINKTPIRLFTPEQRSELASKLFHYVKAKLGLKYEDKNEELAQVLILSEDLRSHDYFTEDEVLLALKMGLNGEFLGKDQSQVYFNSSNFVIWLKSYQEKKRLALANVKIEKQVEPKPIPTEMQQKEMAINIANDYADLIKSHNDKGQEFQFPYGGLSHLYDALDKFNMIKLTNEEKLQMIDDIKKVNFNKPNDSIVMLAKGEAFRKFVRLLASTNQRFDVDGKLIKL